jgi:hypothetical protein
MQKLSWKELKPILVEKHDPQELKLGSNKLDNTNFDNFHDSWNGTKKGLEEYIKKVKKEGAVEAFIYCDQDPDYFFTIWNSLEGKLI